MSAPDLSTITEGEWTEARRRLPIVRRLAEMPGRTRADVLKAACELGLGPTHIYALLKRFALDPRLTALLPQGRGPKRGSSRLSAEVDDVIDDVVASFYLTRQQPKVKDVVDEVHIRCRRLGLTLPGRKAICSRIAMRPLKDIVTGRRGRKAARDLYAPAIGSLEALWPLSLVQIDHTLVDVIVVDSQTREPLQRPWLTLAIDVCTRCVAGFHLSLEPPSATSVGLCLSHAALSKASWLVERGVDAEWPVWGIPERLHLDNAKEFRSEALKRGCEQYGIAIDYRPVRTPHYGGHIERLIGTMMGKVHLLPGTTFSDIRVKGDLNPEKTAAMTLDEVEQWLTHAIVGVYHREMHRGIGMPPLAAWERGIIGDEVTPGRGEPMAVIDPRRFLIDFLPLELRLIRREGVWLNSIGYWADVLGTWIGHPHKVIIRYDPRDLSRIYLLAPDGVYYDLTYRDLRRPAISLWEHRLALKRLREEGRSHVDEAAIFQAIETMRRIADEAVRTTKAMRRHKERRLRLVQAQENPSGNVPISAAVTTIPSPSDGLQPHERMFPVEEW